jgi:hypothetical protein
MYSAGMEGAAAGCLMKKVSCASRAGCCCGWKSASKFQKEDSTYLTEGRGEGRGGGGWGWGCGWGEAYI